MAVLIDGLTDKQPDEEKVVKGPIKNVAYDENGNLTKAGLGFANKCGINETELFLQDDIYMQKFLIK